MSDKIRGHKNFEIPQKDEIDDYLNVSKRSVERMKNGLEPITFHPKNARSKRVNQSSYRILAFLMPILFLVIILFPIILGANSPFIPRIDDNTSTITDSTTTDLTTTEPDISSNYYNFEEMEIDWLLEDLKGIIANDMIRLENNQIFSIFKDGNENDNKTITKEEFLDLIWYLSISPDEDLRDLGYLLVFNEEINPILSVNASLLIDNSSDLTIQLRTLRAFLAYSSNPFSYNLTSIFLNQCISLWKSITSHFNNETGFFVINNSNETIIDINDQIIALNVLTILTTYDEIENINVIKETATILLNSTSKLIGNRAGVPELFFQNNTALSQMFRLKNQVELLLAINIMKYSINIDIINTIFFSMNIDLYSTNEWSYNEALSVLTYNSFGDKKSFNQALVIINKAYEGNLNSAKYISEYLFNKLSTSNERKSYIVSDQNSSEILIDQVVIYNALHYLIQKVRDRTSDTSAAYGVGFLSTLVIFVLLSIKKGKLRRKRTINVSLDN